MTKDVFYNGTVKFPVVGYKGTDPMVPAHRYVLENIDAFCCFKFLAVYDSLHMKRIRIDPIQGGFNLLLFGLCSTTQIQFPP